VKPRRTRARSKRAPFTLADFEAARGGKVSAPAPSTKRHKYGATVVRDASGVKLFDSSKESRRAFELSVLERRGDISDLSTQPKFPIIINGIVVCEYWGDFLYRDRSGAWVVEDTKSEQTRKLRLYSLKRKLMRALLGVTILES